VRRNCVSFRKELGRELGRDVSQQELADMSSLSLDAIRGYEQGQRMPGRKAMMLLSQVFGRAMVDFFLEAPPPANPARRIAVRVKIIGPLDDDLRDIVLGTVARVNEEQSARGSRGRRGRPPARGRQKGPPPA